MIPEDRIGIDCAWLGWQAALVHSKGRVAELEKQNLEWAHSTGQDLARLHLAEQEIARLRELLKADPDETIDDGCGSVWSRTCPACGLGTMQVVRPGKVHCVLCR